MKITYYANGQISSFEGTPSDLVDAGMIQRVERPQAKQPNITGKPYIQYTRQQIEGWKWQPLWEKYGD